MIADAIRKEPICSGWNILHTEYLVSKPVLEYSTVVTSIPGSHIFLCNCASLYMYSNLVSTP